MSLFALNEAELGFIARCRLHPEDDALRAVYHDWLCVNGEAKKAHVVSRHKGIKKLLLTVAPHAGGFAPDLGVDPDWLAVMLGERPSAKELLVRAIYRMGRGISPKQVFLWNIFGTDSDRQCSFLSEPPDWPDMAPLSRFSDFSLCVVDLLPFVSFPSELPHPLTSPISRMNPEIYRLVGLSG